MMSYQTLRLELQLSCLSLWWPSKVAEVQSRTEIQTLNRWTKPAKFRCRFSQGRDFWELVQTCSWTCQTGSSGSGKVVREPDWTELQRPYSSRSTYPAPQKFEIRICYCNPKTKCYAAWDSLKKPFHNVENCNRNTYNQCANLFFESPRFETPSFIGTENTIPSAVSLPVPCEHSGRS